MFQAIQSDFLTISGLRKALDVTWYRLGKYRKRSVIPLPDGFQNGRPMWKSDRLPAIRAAVSAYEEGVLQAWRNELQKQREAEREAEEARQARSQELAEMCRRKAEEALS